MPLVKMSDLCSSGIARSAGIVVSSISLQLLHASPRVNITSRVQVPYWERESRLECSDTFLTGIQKRKPGVFARLRERGWG
jgi:hypothetical protein